MKPHLLGVDLGTGGCKTILIDTDGNVVATAYQEYPTSYPAPGWSEQNPEDWYAALRVTVAHCLRSAKVPATAIAAVGLDAPAHNAVLLDHDGAIIRPTIIWTDQRSARQVKWLEERFGEEIFRLTYQWVNPTWTLPQLLWIKEMEPDLWGRVHRVMIGKDYPRYRLTGTWETDWIDALSTQLVDAAARHWSPRLCGILDLDLHKLPRIVSPAEVVGTVSRAASEVTGLSPGTPVITGSSDSAVEALGAGAVAAGHGIVKLATAGYVSTITPSASPDRRTLTYYHLIDGLWYSVAATNSAASAMRWFRDAFLESTAPRSGALSTYSLLDAEAAEVPVGAEGLIFHPYLIGERAPLWDPFIRGDFLGITMRHARGHFVRSVLEGVAFSIRDCLNTLRTTGLEIRDARVIGGGARSPLWRQILADVLGVELLSPAVADAAFGAALLGGVGAGLFGDLQAAVSTCVRTQETTSPQPDAQRRYDDLFAIYVESQERLRLLSCRLHDFAVSGKVESKG